MKANVFCSTDNYIESDYRETNNFILTLGLWIDGQVYWLKNGSEKLLMEQSITLNVKKRSIHSDVELYDIYVHNHTGEIRTCKLLFTHQYKDLTKDDFSFVSPVENVIFHCADERISLINCQHYGNGMSQSTVQPLWNYQSDNLWTNLNQGILRYQPMIQGSSISIAALDIILYPRETAVGTCWTIIGQSKDRLLQLNNVIAKSY